VQEAQDVRVAPQPAEIIFWQDLGVAGKYAEIAGVADNYIDLYSDGVHWHLSNAKGVVAREA
jgi:hypothetical protein